VTARHHLDGVTSQRLWNWLLSRQGLADGSRLPSAVSIAEASLGLHAARLPSPFTTLAARSASPSVPMSLLRPDRREDLRTVRCMRKTLHALPPALAAAAHAATVHFRERDALRAITNAGHPLRLIDRVIDLLVALLTGGRRRGHREIEAALVAAGVDRTAARLALKLAWERGQISYLNQTDGWNREVRTFQLADHHTNACLTRDEATTTLITAYFDRYGPASLADATWWSGLSRAVVLAALAAADLKLAQVTTSWSAAPQFMHQRNFESFRESAGHLHTTGINLLAHEDVALKAYHQTRQRYLGPLPPARAFNSIGEALPAVLHDGQAIGTWTWDQQRHEAVCCFARGLTSPAVRQEARARARRLTTVLRHGLSTGSTAR
jgi:Winged helix DNA-binding domain